MGKRLIVVDISNFIFRAFFAIRPLHAPDKTPVNAVYGVMNMMLKLLSQYRPSHMILARDSRGKGFRHELYEDYKAHREEHPEDLVPQFPLIEELVTRMGLPNLAMEGYEADDVIGSIVVQWQDYFDEVFIASGDKDLMQFVNDKVKVLDTMKDIIYDSEGVYRKMGVRPSQIVDYLSILGDSSDNVPGMKGIGVKGASKLLGEYGSLDECIKFKDTFTNKRIKNAFENHLEDAFLSKKLVQIESGLDLGMKEDDVEFKFYPSDELIEFVKGMGFKSMLKKIDEIKYADFQSQKNESNGQFTIIETGTRARQLQLKHTIVTTGQQFDEINQKLKNAKEVAIFVRFSDGDIKTRKVIALSICLDGAMTFYLPFNHSSDSLLNQEVANLDIGLLDEVFKNIFDDQEKEVLLEDGKSECVYCLTRNLKINAQIFDISQAQYVLDPISKNDVSYLSSSLLGLDLTELDKASLENFPVQGADIASTYCGERAAAIFLLSRELKEKLQKEGLEKVYYQIDNPLIPVLAQMEDEGILINRAFFSELEIEYSEILKGIESEIEEFIKGQKNVTAGEMINLRSSKQLSELLFNQLAMPVIKKTKTGFSTDSEVLEELNAMNINKVPGLILTFREMDKLLSTYVKALPLMVNGETGRIHTHYRQHTVATGRLSSERPNLQNIPVKTPQGRRIRKGFIATPGKILLSADYSQVELRILANLSGDETMINFFLNGMDIHAQTASEVMGVPLDKISDNERGLAKAINFGLMYGQSSFGLARTLHIPRKKAGDYITKYFERFSRVKRYIDSLKELCERRGYAETHYGRKRYLPDIHSQNRNIKARAERVAINAPIQGTAADIIKMAMINIDKEIKKRKLSSRMLLQVHDELIFEVEEEEINIMKKVIRDKMESVDDFRVPLEVNMGIGVNWFDLK